MTIVHERPETESERPTDGVIWTPEYTLRLSEIKEAFRLVEERRGRRKRTVALAAVFAVGVFATVGYAREPRQAELMFLGFLTVVVFLAVAFAPAWRARLGASKVARRRGFYRLGLTTDGRAMTPDGDEWPLRGDRRSRGFETEELFAVRSDQLRTFCLPKRTLTTEQIDAVRDVLRRHLNFFEKTF